MLLEAAGWELGAAGSVLLEAAGWELEAGSVLLEAAGWELGALALEALALSEQPPGWEQPPWWEQRAIDDGVLMGIKTLKILARE